MKAEALLAGIRDANYHEGGIRCLQIFRVEEPFFIALQADVERLRECETGSKVVEPQHVTHWTGPRGDVVQYSLLNPSGRFDEFRADHDLSCFGKRFRGAAKYPTLARLVELFPDAVNFRVNVLGGGARLSPHEEHSVIRTRSGSIALRVRLHLAVFTNDGAEIVLDGAVYHLKPGLVYLVNHGCVHSARNEGHERRVHLVWDVLFTRETYAFLFEETPPVRILLRVAENEQVPAYQRMETVGAYARIAPHVTREQASQIGWCEVQ